jgi:hypothetical protein
LLLLLGADGDTWGDYGAVEYGTYRTAGYLICDGKIDTDSTCSEFDLATKNTWGWPSFFTVSVEQIDAQCTGTPDFQVRGRHLPDPNGDTTALGSSMSAAGVDSQDFGITHRYIDVALTDDPNCDAPGNDLGLVLYWER